MKNTEGTFVSVIIAAAGKGTRMNSDINKQYINICGVPVLARSIGVFQECKLINEIIVVVNKDDIIFCKKNIIDTYEFTKVTQIVAGGDSRQKSVLNGLNAVNKDTEIVLIHDGARPFVKIKNIMDSIKGASEYGACVVGTPVKDTIKFVKSGEEIDSTPNRDILWAAQTPQSFKREILMEGYRKAIEDNFIGTDDSVLVERLGIQVKIIMGSYENIKITTPEDIIIAESILKDKAQIYAREEFIFNTR